MQQSNSGKEPRKIHIEYINIFEIVKWDKNPKKHNIPAIEHSISKFGYINPIVINEANQTILAGHGRLESLIEMKRLNMDPPLGIKVGDEGNWFAPVIRGITLNQNDHLAYTIADNQLTMSSGFRDNITELLKEIEDLGDINLNQLGFSQDDLKKMDVEIKEFIDGDFEIKEMEVQPFEHYDYIVCVFRDVRDWMYIQNFLNINTEKITVGKTVKTGIGRIIDGRKLIDVIKRNNIQGQVSNDNDAQNNRQIPATVRGISKVRNWVMDNIKTDIVIMFDDDITNCNCIIGPRYYRLSRNDITQLLINTALTAKNLGVCCFGFNQTWDIRKYSPFEPFKLNTWVGGVVGVVSREIRWDEKLTCKCDIDYSLQNLQKKRILWVDQRHSFVQKRDKNLGGNSIFRTQDIIDAERKCLKRKWGSHIRFSNVKTTQRTIISVNRKSIIQ